MSDWSATIPRSHRLGEAAAWLGAGALAFGVHVGGAAYLLHQPRQAAAGLPAAYVIEMELAPMSTADALPDAAPDVPTSYSPDRPLSPTRPEEPDTPEEETPPPPEVLEQAELEPLPDLQEIPSPDLPEQEPELETAAEKPEVALPKKVEKPKPKPPEKKVATAQKPPSIASAAAKVENAPIANRSAAPASAEGASNSQAELRWKDRVDAHLARHMKKWNRDYRKSVQLTMQMSIDGSGRIIAITVKGNTGDVALEQKLQAHAQRMPALPAPPSGHGRTFVVPLLIKP